MIIAGGSPAEVAEFVRLSPEFRALAAGQGAAPVAQPVLGAMENGNGLPKRIHTFLEVRLGNNAPLRARFERFLKATGEFGPDMEQDPGFSTRSHDGFTRYVWGRRSGAKAIFYAYNNSRVSLRLPAEIAEPYGPHVVGLGRVDGYNVRVLLTNEKAVDDAIELARLAYDRALEEV